MRTPNAFIAIIAGATFASGCASPSRPYRQLPLRLDVFVVQNDRVHFPSNVLTGPMPGIEAKAALVGDPWSEAAKIIAQAVSDIFKHAYHAGEVGARVECGWSTTTFRLLSIQWGEGYDLKRAELMWGGYLEYLKKLPSPVPVYSPRVEDYARAMQEMQGWSDKPKAKGGAER